MIEANTIDFWHAAKLMGKDLGLSVGSCGKGEPMQGVPVTDGRTYNAALSSGR